MKKILVISVPNYAKGGVASVVSTFMKNNYINSRYNISYYFTHEPSGYFKKHLSFFYFLIRFPFFLHCNNFDGAHVHGSLKGSFFRKSCFLFWIKMYKIPVIYQCHAAQVDEFFSNSIKKYIVSKIFKQYDLRLCLGNYWKSNFENITELKWNVLHNPVSTFSIKKSQHEDFNLLFMGELSKRKGIRDLIEAFSLVKNDKAKLYVAGNGDISSLTDLCNKLGIEKRVKFLGWIDSEKKSSLLSIADVVVLPSYAEGLPISILEAMSASVAVITTPVGAIGDAITHDVSGMLIPPGNIHELAKAINILASDKTKRLELATLGKEKFDQLFQEDVVAQKLLGFYELLTNKEGDVR
ncbi:glycosyltransferase family 4 protein [Vibrio metoecus]|uniref:glycosyltransferase family 4 protein n=1 Tax=Vibrio metoecus TaxID=1481663 RepID=UPI0012AE9D2A|nr:glycosyltransferase family 4 protein [Vibrio metoecus]